MSGPRLPGLAALALLAGCAGQLDHLGRPPSMTPLTPAAAIPNEAAPTTSPQWQIYQSQTMGSLWQPGARAFFKDLRAKNRGDLLTVVIDMNEQAKLSNATDRSREAGDNLAAPHLFGFESKLDKILPNAVDPTNLLDTSGSSTSNGTGTINRQERIVLRVGCTITDRLPSGNYVIAGRQEVRVNFELRELLVQGVIRPEDITSENTISYDKIAEARISYGGRGQITDLQQPRLGRQLLDMALPF